MNFATKLIASAEKAASVAKNFKGFDEMANEDEYIHSEGLNVKTSSRPEPANEDAFSFAESNVSAEPTWSLLDRPAVVAASANVHARGRPVSRNASTISSASPASSISPPSPKHRPPQILKPAPQRSTMPLLSVVADALEMGSKSQLRAPAPQTSFSGYDTDNEESNESSSSSSDDSDNEEDAILSQIRKSKSLSSSKHSKIGNYRRAKKGKTKNPNRFMEELEHCGPAPVPGSASAAEFAQKYALEMEQSPTDDKSGSGGRLSFFKAWISPLPAGSLASKATSFLKRGPLSRRDGPTSPARPAEAEEFQILAGTSVLSDEELEALAQMNSQSQQSMFSPSTWVQKMRKNPRESFIVFTMLLAIFAYFFTRRTSERENDVQ